jgi:hypothetical protein
LLVGNKRVAAVADDCLVAHFLGRLGEGEGEKEKADCREKKFSPDG